MKKSGLGLAPAKEQVYKSQTTISIQGGNVIDTDKEVYVSPRAIIHFVNNDPDDYVLRFFIRGEDPYQSGAAHPDVDLYLPAFGTSSVVAGLNLGNGECKYLVVCAPAISLAEGSIFRKIQDKLTIADHTLVLQTKLIRTIDSETSKDPIDEISHPVALDTKTGGGGSGGTIHIH